jgi:hypothetical protein
MSSLSENVRTALYSKMSVTGVTSLATGGIYHLLAPVGAKMPYVIFNRQAPAPVTYSFGNTRIAENDLWLIKAVADEDSSSTMEPQQLNEAILSAIETAVGNELTLSGGAVTWNVERFSDIPEYLETASDRMIYYNGFLLRIWSA